MRPQVPTNKTSEWNELRPEEMVQFKPQLVSGFKWLLNMLEETERSRKLPRTRYDQPVQERMRKAS